MLRIFRSAATNRSLVYEMVKRDVIGRYSGSFFGIFWSLFNPILMLMVYTFAFGFVFKARWQGLGDDPFNFALALFPALLVFNYFAECATRATSLITSNPAYVKKVVFPLELLPIMVSMSALFHLFVGVAVWCIAFLAMGKPLHTSLLFVPLAFIPLIIFCIALSLILASLGVFLRDIQQIIGVLTSALMFLSPVFYSIENVPASLKPFIWLNPLTPLIEMVRSAMVFDKLLGLDLYAATLAGSLVFLWLATWWFDSTRKGFADVI